MIVDPSAILAILLDESEAVAFAHALRDAETRRLSTAGYVETAIVLEGRADAMARESFEDFLRDFEIELEPVTAEQARLARAAFRSFGKGIHPAGLNYGDCFTYALAKALREPVLFKGNDFRQTDLIPAV